MDDEEAIVSYFRVDAFLRRENFKKMKIEWLSFFLVSRGRLRLVRTRHIPANLLFPYGRIETGKLLRYLI